jgi:outer membrane murein-binding lipoprotein Lpp
MINFALFKSMKFWIATIVVGFLASWVWWSLDTHAELVTANNKIDTLTTTIETLNGEIERFTTKEDKTEVDFDSIEQAQVDLLCAARYNAPVNIVEKPILQEVVVYRDRITQCPTLDPDKAEIPVPGQQEMRPVSDNIAIQALDNSWKAYCSAIDNKDPLCSSN